MLDQPFFAQIQHFLRCIGNLEQGARGAIHTDIGRLRAERDSHDQRIGVHMLQFPFRFRIAFLKAREYRAYVVITELLDHSRSMP